MAASVCTLQPASDRLQNEEEVIAFVLYSALQRSLSENTINQFIMNLMMWSNTSPGKQEVEKGGFLDEDLAVFCC